MINSLYNKYIEIIKLIQNNFLFIIAGDLNIHKPKVDKEMSYIDIFINLLVLWELNLDTIYKNKLHIANKKNDYIFCLIYNPIIIKYIKIDDNYTQIFNDLITNYKLQNIQKYTDIFKYITKYLYIDNNDLVDIQKRQ